MVQTWWVCKHDDTAEICKWRFVVMYTEVNRSLWDEWIGLFVGGSCLWSGWSGWRYSWCKDAEVKPPGQRIPWSSGSSVPLLFLWGQNTFNSIQFYLYGPKSQQTVEHPKIKTAPREQTLGDIYSILFQWEKRTFPQYCRKKTLYFFINVQKFASPFKKSPWSKKSITLVSFAHCSHGNYENAPFYSNGKSKIFWYWKMAF